ncbi:hypothetical protein N656DRAFT_794154 [Canariomyces notabilis]|uniref:Uncharacterized protein n=1 Tax=Canariomyces notabilis TaxID=2074819 RepID=A0AAN6TPD9_9PEZI|nr:hypothetical protein N656DRAFT_794154 [Canariomyces arenarius]
MPRRRLANPATRVHLFCRALALLFELAVLIFLIYISKTLGYSNGIRYAGVVCAILHNASQVVALTDRHHRLRHVPPPCVVIFDLVILILLGASIGYDFVEALSRLDKRAGPFYRTLLDDHCATKP